MHLRPSGYDFYEVIARRANPFIGDTMNLVIICLCGIPAIILARTIARTWEKFYG